MEEENKQTKICPFCEMEVKSNACPNCNIFIDDKDSIEPELVKETEEVVETEKKKSDNIKDGDKSTIKILEKDKVTKPEIINRNPEIINQ